MPPPPHRLGEAGLTPAHVSAFVRGSDVGHLLDVRPGAEALDRVRRGQADLLAAREHGAVYGLTTGVGALRHVVLEEAGDHDEGPDLRLWRSHAAGVGPELDDDTARATMLVRLHQLLRGGSGVSPGLVEALAAALEIGAVPRLHAYGGLGTGDLTILAELGLTLAGELPWRSGPADPAGWAGSAAGAGGVPLARVVPDPSDSLPFLSSNAATAAVAALEVTRLAGLARAAEQVAALSHLALRGSLQAYDPRVHAAKDDAHAAAVAGRLVALLSGDMAADGAREPARLQDPFALRAVPQVHSPLLAALEVAERAVAAELDVAAENPLAVDGTALHHGQFVTQRLAAALDGLRAAAVPVLTLSVARLAALMSPALSGLPAFLASGPAGSSGLMVLEYVASDLLARSRSLGAPVTASRTVVSLGLEEHASHSTQAAWACRDLADLVPDLLACELVAAVRALRLDPERLPAGGPIRAVHDAVAGLPDVRPDHVLGPALTLAASLVSGPLAG